MLSHSVKIMPQKKCNPLDVHQECLFLPFLKTVKINQTFLHFMYYFLVLISVHALEQPSDFLFF